ncbi:hypothetical protein [Erwinia sp. ErVv1]|uniref:hypothetical protein n=1 Tax=Erwinia sp. ErVv1 TaxID=1603299 RepID=UPI00082BDD8D|nr:hypothetical protein [Erwinia sp. ErVv1]
MKNKKTSALLPFIFLFLSGCSHYSVSTEKLSELSETDLCIALGERNNTGSEVLRITEEIEKRGDKISSEKCYLLSHKAMRSSSDITVEPYAERKYNTTEYDYKKRRWVTKPYTDEAGLTISIPDR